VYYNVIYNFHYFCSGLLTGKFERNKTPDAKGSRIGFVHQDESKAMQAAPAWSQYNDDDNYWKLMDAMKDIAKTHGRFKSSNLTLF
jgi:hypothetical protein